MTEANVTSQYNYNMNEKGIDTIYAFIPTKYQKYQPTTILEHANFLNKVNKSPYVHLLNMTSHDA